MLKWFGADEPHGFTSRSDHWGYAPEQALPRAAEILESLVDMRIPLAMSALDVDAIVAVVREALERDTKESACSRPSAC